MSSNELQPEAKNNDLSDDGVGRGFRPSPKNSPPLVQKFQVVYGTNHVGRCGFQRVHFGKIEQFAAKDGVDGTHANQRRMKWSEIAVS